MKEEKSISQTPLQSGSLAIAAQLSPCALAGSAPTPIAGVKASATANAAVGVNLDMTRLH